MPTTVTHVSKPSSARKIVLDSFVPVPRGSLAIAAAPLNWAAKDPQDVLDYQFDIGPALVGNPGDGIATVDVTVSPQQPGDLAIVSTVADGSSVVLWASGGQPGTVYVVTILIGMTSGRILQRSVLLPVLSLSGPLSPVTAIEISTGIPIIDQYGNPVLTG